MKIAFWLSATRPSGGARVLLEHAKRLAVRGHDTAIVVPSRRDPPAWFDHGRPVLRELASDVDLVVATRYRDVGDAFTRARAPVVHLVQGDDAAGPLAVLKARRRGLAGFLERRRARRKLARLAVTLALPTFKLAVSDALAAKVSTPGISRARVAPDGVDVDLFAPGAPRDVATPARVLISGPRRGPTKGLDEALAAIAIARAHRAITIVHLAPDAGALAPEADERRSDLGAAEVAALFRDVDLFLSLASEDEGFDMPALEALASGVPCVLSDVAIHRALAPEGAALFVDRADATAVAAAIARALDDEALRARLREAGRAAALERSWDRAIVEVERAYAAAARAKTDDGSDVA